MNTHIQMLLAINRFKIMSTKQLAVFYQKTINSMGRAATWGVKNEYINRIMFYLKGTERYAAYSLTTKGMKYLKTYVCPSFGISLYSKSTPIITKQSALHKMNLLHHRLIVDFELSLMGESREMQSFMQEKTQTMPSYYGNATKTPCTQIQIPKSINYPTGVKIIPDAYGSVSTQLKSWDYFFEADRATEAIGHAKMISRPNTLINKYLRYVKVFIERDSWQKKVGSNNPAFRVLTVTSTPSRVVTTIDRLKIALSQAGLFAYAPIFSFLSMEEFKEYGIFGKSWHTPLGEENVWGKKKRLST